MKNDKQLNTTFNTQAYDSREHAEGFYTPMNKPDATLEDIQDVLECFDFVAECINNFTKVENLAKALDCDYNTAFDMVYNSAVIYDENETDDAL
jgi:hypothetical protein